MCKKVIIILLNTALLIFITSCKWELPVENTWNGVPIFPGAIKDWEEGPHSGWLFANSGMFDIHSCAMFVSKDADVQDAISYYQNEMIKQGWREENLFISNEPVQSHGQYSKNDYSYYVEIVIDTLTSGGNPVPGTSILIALLNNQQPSPPTILNY